MTIDEKYMHRCLQLALNGKGFVSPNPMVGAVIIHNKKIIGEGFHHKHGGAHAEVNAVNSVKDKALLKESVIYVSLEPCAHHGKTPPCAQLIIDHQIPHVVVANLDPFPSVSGRGMKMLQNAGIDVKVGVLEKEASSLNKEFFMLQSKNRPYIYLKWAQTKDGFIDRERDGGEDPQPTLISNEFSQIIVHKRRAEISAIMIGTNTAINDNPSLSTRFWYGKNPERIILDRHGRIPSDYNLFDGKVKTIIFTEKELHDNPFKNVTFIPVAFDENLFENIFSVLKAHHIDSVMVEGGQKLLKSLIEKQLWDEAFVEISSVTFGKGLKAPVIAGNILKQQAWGASQHIHLRT